MAEIIAGKHWPFNNRSGAVAMVTPLLFNSNMILMSLHSVPQTSHSCYNAYFCGESGYVPRA
jgi:hypothetical protein